jgi:hypothetical protein
MSEADLSKWVLDIITRRVPESDTIDYKAMIEVDTRPQKLELVKDVSSFANERGGTVLYGIPEDRSGPAPIPQPLDACGITLPQKLPETVENILVETVNPPLPEPVVKAVSIGPTPDKQVLLVYHPASWNRPHMALYEDGRYYRRANFRSVRMSEPEVEAAYAARRGSAQVAIEFFNSADFGLPAAGSFSHGVVCPRHALFRPDVMREAVFRAWLEETPPEGRRGLWIPFPRWLAVPLLR